MRKLFSFLVLLAATAGLFAQAVNGILKDERTGEAVPFANVALLRLSDSSFVAGTVTDMEGSFALRIPSSFFLDSTLAGFERGGALLRISAVGYETLMEHVDYGMVDYYQESLPASPTTFALHPDAGLLQEVRITEKKPLFVASGEKTLYNTSDDPSIQTGTASDALQNAPGVEVDAEGNITLRGTQSVTVWINDQPSHLEGEALKQYIKTLPANSIERIEVIKNPSARYGGGTPVINIVTNKKVNRNEFFSIGANGNISSKKPGITPWISYVYANERLNVSLWMNYGFENTRHTSVVSEQMRNDDGSLASSLSSSVVEEQRNRSGYMGFSGSYRFDTLNSIMGYFGGYPYRHHSLGDYQADWMVFNPSTMDCSYREITNYDGPIWGGWGGLTYEHRFDSKGHKLSLGVSGSANNQSYSHRLDRTYDVLPEMNIHDSIYSSFDVRSFSVLMDYVLPFGDKDSNGTCKNELEAGVSQTFGMECRDRSFDTLSAALHGWGVDLLRTFGTNSTSRNSEAYLTLSRSMGGLNLKLGVRGSYDALQQKVVGHGGCDFEKHYFYLTPSLHASYSTEKMHNFSLGYTRRCHTPGASSLTRFVQYNVDDFQLGNPDLRPEYTHSLNASWDKYYENFGSIGIEADGTFSKDEQGDLTDVVFSDYFGRVVSFSQPINIGSSYNFSVDANVTYRPSSFFNLRFTAGVMDDYYHVQFRPGEWAENEKWSYHLRLNAWAKVWGKLQIFATARYSSERQSMFSTYKPSAQVDLGMSADFLNRKLSCYVNVFDIFNISSWGYAENNPYYQMDGNSKWVSRYLNFGITLRFGKLELSSMAQEGNGANSSSTSPVQLH